MWRVAVGPPMIEETLAGLRAAGIIAIVRGRDPERVLRRADELVELGARAIEVTLDTPDAMALLGVLADRLPPQVLLGAGSVMSSAQVPTLAALGVRYALSPVRPQGFVSACLSAELLPIPGAATPQEVWAAHEAGAPLVKLYPADRWTPAEVNSWPGPLRSVQLVPTGGLGVEHLEPWFALPQVAAIGMGSRLTGPDLALPPDAGPEEAAPREAAWQTEGRGRTGMLLRRWADRPV